MQRNFTAYKMKKWFMREIGFPRTGGYDRLKIFRRDCTRAREGWQRVRRVRRWPRKIPAVISRVYRIIDYRIKIAWNMISSLASG